MVDALEGTYLKTRELLEDAPRTPEFQEIHQLLESESRALEESWRPLRHSLQGAVGYSKAIADLVRHRDSQQASGEIRGALEGLLGPVGLLTGPILSLPVGHEFRRIGDQLSRARHLRSNVKNLMRTMRVVQPALDRFLVEVHDDFENLHSWTERTVHLLQEQNRRIHQEELAMARALEEHQKLILRRLRLFAQHEKLGLEIRMGIQPSVARTFLGKINPVPNGKGSRQLLEDLAEVHSILQRHHRGFPPSHLVHRFLRDLERIREGFEAYLHIEGVLGLLGEGGEPPSGSRGSTAYFDRSRHLVEKLGQCIPHQYASHREGWVEELRTLEGKLVTQVSGLEIFLARETRRVGETLSRGASTGAIQACASEGMLVSLQQALREIEDVEAVSGKRPAGLSTPLERVRGNLGGAISLLLDRLMKETLIELEWFALLGETPENPGDPGCDFPPSCFSGISLGEEGTTNCAQRAQGYLREVAFCQSDRDLVKRLRSRSGALQERMNREGGENVGASLLTPVHVLGVEVHRVWERGRVLRELVRVDPELAAQAPWTTAAIRAREAFWRQEFQHLVEQRQLIARQLQEFQKRDLELGRSKKEIHALLHKGKSALHQWRDHHGSLGKSPVSREPGTTGHPVSRASDESQGDLASPGASSEGDGDSQGWDSDPGEVPAEDSGTSSSGDGDQGSESEVDEDSGGAGDTDAAGGSDTDQDSDVAGDGDSDPAPDSDSEPDPYPESEPETDTDPEPGPSPDPDTDPGPEPSPDSKPDTDPGPEPSPDSKPDTDTDPFDGAGEGQAPGADPEDPSDEDDEGVDDEGFEW